MSESQNGSNLGEQFKIVVQEALESGDFKQLNDLVAGTVSGALAEAGKQVKMASEEVNKAMESGKTGTVNDTFHYRTSVQVEKKKKQKKAVNTYRAPYPPTPYLPMVKTKKVGQVSSVLYIVFGSIGMGAMAIVLLIGLIFLLSGKAWSLGAYGILAGVFTAFLLMIQKGCVKSKRLNRMQRYIRLCAGRMYINLEDLAKQANKSKKFIVKDIKKMLKLGFFPEGHLDEQENCLMLDDATYRQYLSLEKERKAREMEAKTIQMKEKQRAGMEDWKEEKEADRREGEKPQTEEEKANQELDAMIQEGQDCIRKLRDMNDVIEGEAISAKLFRLENLLKEIFERVKEHPEQMPQMHKVMNYYLPTTLKLVQAYQEFDNISAPGEDILTAKAEIEKTLDTINEAFTELLNKLFRDAAFDVTTDAQVLQTMLAKEGLTREMEKEPVLR